jgi:hypothetical protein
MCHGTKLQWQSHTERRPGAVCCSDDSTALHCAKLCTAVHCTGRRWPSAVLCREPARLCGPVRCLYRPRDAANVGKFTNIAHNARHNARAPGGDAPLIEVGLQRIIIDGRDQIQRRQYRPRGMGRVTYFQATAAPCHCPGY